MVRHLVSTLISLLLLGCVTTNNDRMTNQIHSGLQPGDDVVPWNPIHVAGPNAGTNACPICTYEARPAIQVFARDNPKTEALAVHLQQLVEHHQASDLKGFVIVLDSTPQRLKQLARDNQLSHIGICYPDPQTCDHDLRSYKINPAADNTIVVYKNYKVVQTFVNLTPADLATLDAAVDPL